MNVMKSLVGVWVLGVLACTGTKDVAPLELLSLEVSGPGTSFSAGASVQLEASGLYSNGQKEVVTTQVRWDSSDSSIATVDSSGQVKLLSQGSAIISASRGEVAASITMQVSASPLRSLELTPTAFTEIAKGNAAQLHVDAIFSDGTHRDVCAEASWSSSGGTVTPMDTKGTFRFESEGMVVVTARFGGLTAERVVIVRPAAVTALRIAPFASPLKPGQRVPVQVSATFTDGSTRDVSLAARISSLDPTIAQVTDGVALALTAGTARLVAELGGQSSSRALTITARELVSFTSSLPSVDVASGRSVEVKAYAGFDDGSTLEVSDSATWTSSDAAVAQVVSGVIWGHSEGRAIVTVSYGGRQLELAVLTQAALLEQLFFSLPQNVRLLEGQSVTFSLTGRYSDGSTVELSPVATLRASPLISVSQSATGVTVTGLAAGPASLEVEVSGVVRRLSLSVSDASIGRLRMQQAFTASGEPLQQLRVEADYSDGFSQDVTELCTWTSTDAAQIAVSDAAGSRGSFQGLGAATVSAELMGHWVSFTFVMP